MLAFTRSGAAGGKRHGQRQCRFGHLETQPSALSDKSGLFSDWKWGPPGDSFCRIEQTEGELAFHCLAMGQGTAAITGNHIHLAWGSMMARLVIDADFQSDSSFAGHAAAKLAGISIEDPGPSTSAKINPAPGAADKGGKLLQTIVSDGLVHVPHDPKVKDSPALQEPNKLGSAQAFIYLGQQPRSGPPGTDLPDFFAVYAVEFDNGERICGLHQRDDGMLDAFQCA